MNTLSEWLTFRLNVIIWKIAEIVQSHTMASQVGWWGIVWSCVSPHWSSSNLAVSVLVYWWNGAWQTRDNSVTPTNADEMLTSSVRPPSLKFKFPIANQTTTATTTTTAHHKDGFIREHTVNKLKWHCILLNITSLRRGLSTAVPETKQLIKLNIFRHFICIYFFYFVILAIRITIFTKKILWAIDMSVIIQRRKEV